MSTRFKLDEDERLVIASLVERTIIHQKIIKYAKGHGYDLLLSTFDYNKETGEVRYPSEDLTIT